MKKIILWLLIGLLAVMILSSNSILKPGDSDGSIIDSVVDIFDKDDSDEEATSSVISSSSLAPTKYLQYVGDPRQSERLLLR